jgi:metal-responsive CopG/Arc/MetJ family transcriptional regulator
MFLLKLRIRSSSLKNGVSFISRNRRGQNIGFVIAGELDVARSSCNVSLAMELVHTAEQIILTLRHEEAFIEIAIVAGSTTDADQLIEHQTPWQHFKLGPIRHESGQYG